MSDHLHAIYDVLDDGAGYLIEKQNYLVVVGSCFLLW